jgi:hypothetical protein
MARQLGGAAARKSLQHPEHTMTSNARRKIDGFTQQLFDAEVDKPEHDQVLTALFEDRAAQAQILTEFHQLEPLLPIEDYAPFRVFDGVEGRWLAEPMSYADATTRCGPFPTWQSRSPLRLVTKQLECLMDYRAAGANAARLMGFMDMAVLYDIQGKPTIHVERGKWNWEQSRRRFLALFEIKGEWPSAGNLIRQLNLYRACSPRDFSRYAADYAPHGYHERSLFVVGPDESMHALVNEHNYRLVTFDRAGTGFSLHPQVSTPPAASGPEPF